MQRKLFRTKAIASFFFLNAGLSALTACGGRVDSATHSAGNANDTDPNAANEDVFAPPYIVDPVTNIRNVAPKDAINVINPFDGKHGGFDPDFASNVLPKDVFDIVSKGAVRPDEDAFDDPALQAVLAKFNHGPSMLGVEAELISQDEFDIVRKHASRGHISARKANSALTTMSDAILKAVQTHRFIDANAVAARAKQNRLTRNDVQDVIGAKELWINLLNSQGSVLSLNSYSPESGVLTVKALSQLQSPQIDEGIREHLIAEHNVSAAKSRIHAFKTVVQGGGPIGLYATFKVFRTGSNVYLYNSRSEVFERKQIIRLDPKWQAQLRLYLGTQFDELFVRSGRGVFRPDGFVETPIQYIEDSLKLKLVELQSTPRMPKDALDLSFNTQVTAINNPTSSNPKFSVEITSGGTVRQVGADMVVLAGGSSNNVLRDRELSPAYAVTTKKLHSISVWDKWTPGLDNMLRNTETFRVKITNADIADGLEKENMDEFVRDFLKSEYLTPSIQSRFSTPISDLIRSETVEQDIDVRQFENMNSVYLAYKVPNQIAELRAAIEAFSKTDTDANRVARCRTFLKGLETVWHDAGVKILTYHNPDGEHLHLERDPSPISHGTFYVEQITGDDTIKVYHAPNGATLVVVAAGDALISPHFMTWSGLNAGRRTVDDLVKAQASYMANPTTDVAFTVELHNDHQRVKAFLLTRGQVFLEPLSPDTKRANAIAKMAETLESIAATQGSSLVDGQVRVEKSSARANVYQAQWTSSVTGTRVSKGFSVGFDGHLQLEGTTSPSRMTSYKDIYFHFESAVR